jgi:uncharacterized protein (TIGR03663 family)
MAVGPSRDETTTTGWHTVGGVCVVVVLALLARFVALGDRVAHWDEGRVAYWILDYVRTGEFSYRPIIHGPFYELVTPVVFDLFGATDATMRFVPALVSGLLPLSVLLLRDRFDTGELLAMAFFLAFNPLLLYYGRFMRGDPLVGAFMFTAFALFVRFYDTRLYRHLFAGVAFTALGFTVKENAPVYVLCWLGGLAVYGYLVVFAARRNGDRPLRAWAERSRRRVRTHDWSDPLADGGAGVQSEASNRPLALRALFGLGIVACCLLLFFAVFVAFYAPRGATGVTVSTTVADPTLLPALLEEATVGSFQEFYSLWGDGGQSEHAYLPYLQHLVSTLGAGAFVVGLLAVVGFLADSTREGGTRPLVVVAFLWGLASVFGYPIITDIKAPWAATHVVFPWVIPAAVGLGTVLRWGSHGLAHDDRVSVGFAVVLVLLATGVPTYTAYQTSFAEPQAESNPLVQYAQPSAEIHPEMAALEALAERNEGTDVVLYGDSLVKGDPLYQEPSCSGAKGWFNALPLPWYLERADAETACAETPGALSAIEGSPPVVVSTLEHREALEERFPDYTVTVRSMRLYGSEWVFLVDTSRLPADENPLADVESASVVDGADPAAANGSGAVTDSEGANTTGGSETPTAGDGTARTVTPAVTARATAEFHYG